MESLLSMGGAIILIALFGAKLNSWQQHNMSRSCDLQLTFTLRFYDDTKKAFIWSEYAWLYEKDPKEFQNNTVQTTEHLKLHKMVQNIPLWGLGVGI